MSSVNRAIIIGRVGKDPELRYMANGDAVCTMTVATSETWKDKTSGEKKEATEWHRVSLFARQAEIAGEYLKKGSLVYFSGPMKTREWTDKDDVKRYTTELHAREMQFLSPKPESSEKPASRAPASRPQAKSSGGFDDMDNDLPY